VDRIKTLLPQIGLEPARVRMFNMSSAMANQFVAAVNEMSQQIVTLGPNPIRMPKTTSRRPDKESEP
jgi:coenzyme F420-reducing hydrogenase delta subunit